MRVLITGATGFVGRAITLRLLRDGHEVMAWVRSPKRARSLVGADVELIAADDDTALREVLERADAVVNLAGEPVLPKRWSAARKRALVASRVQTTKRLVDVMERLERRPAVFVSASAVGFYGDTGAREVDEASPQGRDFLAELCAAWETEAERAESLGVRVVRLRIGIVLGPEGGVLGQMAPLFRTGVGGPWGSGKQYVPWIHLADLAELAVTALTDPHYKGAVNAVAPHAVTVKALALALGRALHRPAFLPAPSLALHLLLGEAASALTFSQRVVPKRLTELGFRYGFPELPLALANIFEAGRQVRFTPAGELPHTPYIERRRPVHVLEQTTRIAAPLGQVFPFFSRAENLGVVTPSLLGFVIRSPLPITMHAGATIDYRIKIGPLPLTWRTSIETWQPDGRFVDVQERGPYRAWWHEHRFEVDGNGTLMHDRVMYAAPLGLLGRLVNALFIRGTLRRIFAYRTQVIALRFGPGR